MLRDALGPVYVQAGYDFDLTIHARPASQVERALEALRTAGHKLLNFAYVDAWPGDKRLARRAARAVEKSFHEDFGRDAIVVIATGFAEQYARDNWQHKKQAEASRALGATISDLWPVPDDDPARSIVREQAQTKEAAWKELASLPLVYWRARVTIEGLADALEPRLNPELTALLCSQLEIAPDPEFDELLAADWRGMTLRWEDLLSPSPMSYSEATDAAELRSDSGL